MIILTIIIHFLLSYSKPIQNIEIVRFPDYYNGCGVVFPHNYQLPIQLPEESVRYTPNEAELRQAEEVIHQQLVELEGLDKSFLNNVKNYNRQYVGFLNNERKKIVIIQLLNFKSKKAKDYFEGWQKEYPILAII